ncbi:hypothetical protein [Actinomadura rubrisoli]|uniref:Uncharacterized protein n=1 Tax=Actinomadura rubrisoli TaxID=2530368 RepID=A0A4R5AC34_9ACTN|nr:hypothetical protein [Actinomadura rubrisoli]TDD68579.1 hypothetical protein E1298_38255 [Actinomadura rubrisoli]
MSLATEIDRTPRETLRVLARRVLAMPFMSVVDDLAELSTITDPIVRDDTFTHLCAALVERDETRVEGLLDELTADEAI